MPDRRTILARRPTTRDEESAPPSTTTTHPLERGLLTRRHQERRDIEEAKECPSYRTAPNTPRAQARGLFPVDVLAL